MTFGNYNWMEILPFWGWSRQQKCIDDERDKNLSPVDGDLVSYLLRCVELNDLQRDEERQFLSWENISCLDKASATEAEEPKAVG